MRFIHASHTALEPRPYLWTAQRENRAAYELLLGAAVHT